jgi:Tetratricopeptide repeat
MSARLDAADRPDDARASSEEAVCFYRQLARSKPKYLPDVARLLADQAKDLQARGQHEQSVTLLDEVVIIRRRLADADPSFRLQLARSLGDLSLALSEVDRDEEAAAASEEAVAIWRQLNRSRRLENA